MQSLFPATPLNSSTPQTSGVTGAGGIANFFSNALAGRADLGGSNPTSLPVSTPIKTTPSGGTVFNSSLVGTYTKPAATTNTATVASKPTLSSFVNSTYQTPNGGTISTTGGAGGQVTGFNPASSYSIDTSGAVPSNALKSNLTSADLQNTHSQYQDFVNGLAQAQGYSPDYISAYGGAQQAQANQAAVGTGLVSSGAPTLQNYLQNPQSFGDTQGYAQALNGQEQALASQQSTQQNIALNTQQLARTGNIAAAQTQLQYNPASVSSQNAINQYNTLQQQYPNASIPAYNNSLSPALNQQIAQELVSNSPAYRAQFQQQYSTAAGGTSIYNKLDTGGLQQNSDGTISLVSDAASALGKGQAASVQSSIDTYNKLAPAFKAANDDFTAMTQFMQSAGINNQDLPIENQIQNAINSKVLAPGALAAFKVYTASLRTNYANLLGSRGETPSQAGKDAIDLVPDALKISDLNKVKEALNTNGQNILNATQQQIQQGLSSLQGNASFGGNASIPTMNGGSLYDF